MPPRGIINKWAQSESLSRSIISAYREVCAGQKALNS